MGRRLDLEQLREDKSYAKLGPDTRFPIVQTILQEVRGRGNVSVGVVRCRIFWPDQPTPAWLDIRIGDYLKLAKFREIQ